MSNRRKIRIAVVGYGNRGQVYADYSVYNTDELEVVSVVDVRPFKLTEAKNRYNLSPDVLFTDLDDFIAKKIDCDFVVNATMDQLHYETSLKILNAGYDMLLEKPIVPNEKELRDICDAADKNGCRVFICHVLRYAPYYRKIKSLINDGVIGEIMTMEMNEHVVVAHYLAAYDRGKWNSEEKCGSGFLLAKSCHDLDIMCWLNNATEPKSIASFGGRALFTKENMPDGASEFCYNCKYEQECPYSAMKQYIDLKVMPFLVWNDMDKSLDDITLEEKREFLKKHNYGRCAYIAGKDLVDRQTVIVNFKNGSCASFMLVGGTTKPDRYIHIVGTKGEIEGKIEENNFVLRIYDRNKIKNEGEVVDVSKEVVNNAEYGGHSGGDHAIMKDLVDFYNGSETSLSMTKLSDSVNGHLCVYAAEKSRKEGVIVDLNN